MAESNERTQSGVVKRTGEIGLAEVPAGTATETQVLLGPEDGAPDFAMRRFVMGAGGGMPRHTNAVEHEQYVLAGRARVGIGDRIHEVSRGTVLYIPAGAPHFYEVLEAPFEFLCMVPNTEDRIEILGDLTVAEADSIMSARFGSQSMVAPLRRVLVKKPGAAFGAADPRRWHYSGRPDLEIARREHDAFVETLLRAGAEVLYLEGEQSGSADAIYAHDPAIVADAGAVILNMGKALRRGEPADLAARFAELDVPVIHRLEGEAIAEGGDLLWLDSRTLAVGLGFRTNAAGLDSLAAALEPHGVTPIPVPLPHHRGPEACLHLMSLISVVDDDLAVIFDPLLPQAFRSQLEERGFRFVEVPEQEFESMGTNVLALSPRHCLMLDGNPSTRGKLEQAGCRVETYEGREISLKAEGGPTCLTRPILRAATSRAE